MLVNMTNATDQTTYKGETNMCLKSVTLHEALRRLEYTLNYHSFTYPQNTQVIVAM